LLLVWSPLFGLKEKGIRFCLSLGLWKSQYIVYKYICICSIFKKEMLLGFDTDVLYVMYDTV